MADSKRTISVVGPEEPGDLRLTRPQSYAAGLSAVRVALNHAMREMGIRRSFQVLSRLNQTEGMDCPGCAWPDPNKRSSLGEFCENGVKAVSEEATTKQVTPEFFAQHSITELSGWTDYEIGKSGRLTDPVILRPGSHHYESLSWQEAFDLIAEQLRALEDPNEAIFYTSGRSSNEAAFLYGLFVRSFGTNNLPDCSNMCHESSGVALTQTLGIGKGSVTLKDFGHAEVVIVIGQNPGTNHPRMLSALQSCKASGGRIVTINPLEEPALVRFKNPQEIKGLVGRGTAITDYFLQVRINEDVALLKLIMKRLAHLDVSGDVFDHAFIKEHTAGYEEFLKDLEACSDSELLDRCGVDSREIDRVVKLLAAKKRIIICWAMGLTQHRNAVDNIKACVNLLLLKGSVGIKGGGTCPVRGHSNVQGDRTVGINHRVSQPLNKAIHKVFGFIPPEAPGLDVVHSIQAMHDGRARVFISLGGNLVSAASDTHYTGRALQNCDLTVSISTKLNRTHLVPGRTSLILPTLGRTEQDVFDGKIRFVTVENSMGRVHRSKGTLGAASEALKSEPEIIAGMANSYFGDDSPVDWKDLVRDYDRIRDKISEVCVGFEDYAVRSKGTGFDLPNNSRIGDFSKLPGGKAQFSICQLADYALEKGEFLMMTIRTHDQFNTTIYGMDDRYRGIYNERRVILISEADIRNAHFKAGDVVDLISRYNGQTRRAHNFRLVPYRIPEGNIATYFPEANVLVPIDHFADQSGTPASKSVVVRIEPSGSAGHA